MNLDAHYALPSGWGASVGIYNLLDTHAAAAEFWYVDRLQKEVGRRRPRRCPRTSPGAHDGAIHGDEEILTKLDCRVAFNGGCCNYSRAPAPAHFFLRVSNREEMPIDTDEVIDKTRRWLEKSVIGLNLCPFAAGPYRDNRVHFCVSEQRTASGLLDELRSELVDLQAADPSTRETTLLIHPGVLVEFREYNDFLDACEAAVDDLGLEGELQIASFHPQYQFAGTRPDDIENFTNRSPYPMLHLLREASVERAIAAVGDTDEICRRNIQTLRQLGLEGWQRLWRD